MADAYAPATWRLIVDGEADGATNMAIDEAILYALLRGQSLPTLRFYGWSPPCLSLGRNQPLSDVDEAACRRSGVDVVRRPSGGRAILHTDELTYSIALLQSDPRTEGGVLEGYRRLSRGLLAGLRDLDVAAVQVTGRHREEGTASAICFERPSDYEITVAGRKLVGSAQWRARGGVLQHGSLPLHGDLARIVDYLAFDEEARKEEKCRLVKRALTLEEARGEPLPFAQVARALAVGFARTLNVRLVAGGLSPGEQDEAVALRRSRYAAAEWTEHP
jgi:lipoate-protein ligase A